MNEYIWKFPNHNERYLIAYTKESMRHPAKMHVSMCREIIKRYSKKGELILDPMAGIGTTLIEGALLGRNVIGIEYEQKFVDMGNKNIERMETQLGFMKRGKCVIIKGDARDIISSFKENKELLGDHGIVDSVVFSPPFADQVIGKKESVNFPKNEFKDQFYSSDKENIGNLKYGGNQYAKNKTIPDR